MWRTDEGVCEYPTKRDEGVKTVTLAPKTGSACTPQPREYSMAPIIEIMRARYMHLAPQGHQAPQRRWRCARAAVSGILSATIAAGTVTTRPAAAESVPIQPTQVSASSASPPAMAAPVARLPELRRDAPDRYTLKAGDTLWGLSSRFLKDPWRWPELWKMNSARIDNPNSLQVGQVLLLDRGTATLAVETSERPTEATATGLPLERLSPGTREAPNDVSSIPSIPMSAIGPFLSQVRMSATAEVKGAYAITGTQDGRAAVYRTQNVYAKGMLDAAVGSDWDIYRMGPPLIDPETSRMLGNELSLVGLARVARASDPAATLVVRQAGREIGTGDLLLPRAATPLVVNYIPRAPTHAISAQVIAIQGGRGERSALDSGLELDRPGTLDFDRRREAGALQVISINRGSEHGLEPGHVLSLHHVEKISNDRSIGPFYLGSRRLEAQQLPEERYGLAFVFRTFEQVSYALVVQGTRSVVPGDFLRQP